MSDDVLERDETVRSTIITVFFTVILIIIAIAFWAWSSPGVESPVSALNEINAFIAPIIEVFVMFLFFVFLTTTVVNLRLYVTRIRSGWIELLLLFIVVLVVSWLMFGSNVGLATGVLSLAFIGYLYLLQE